MTTMISMVWLFLSAVSAMALSWTPLQATADMHACHNGTGVEPRRAFLSNTLGSNMVLQRAPQQAVVWGFAAPGTVVKTTMDQAIHLTTAADGNGVWRQRLPATDASNKSHTMKFLASSGESAQM